MFRSPTLNGEVVVRGLFTIYLPMTFCIQRRGINRVSPRDKGRFHNYKLPFKLKSTSIPSLHLLPLLYRLLEQY